MKVPLSATMKLSQVEMFAAVRPKHFLVYEIQSKSGDVRVVRYVRSWPVLLRVRLFLAKLALIKAYQKIEKFKAAHGV